MGRNSRVHDKVRKGKERVKGLLIEEEKGERRASEG